MKVMKYILLLQFIPKNIRNILTIIVSIIFIAGGSINRGFSGFFWAIPFVVIFYKKLKHYTKYQQIILVAILLFVCVPLGWNKTNNTMLYPYIGSQAVFVAGWGYVQYSDSKYYSLLSPERAKNFEIGKYDQDFYSKPLATIDSALTMKMVEMDYSFADFGHQLIPVFVDSDGNKYKIYSRNFIEEIERGTIRSDDLEGVENFQSQWTEFLQNLMYWPMLPIILKGYIDGLFRE